MSIADYAKIKNLAQSRCAMAIAVADRVIQFTENQEPEKFKRKSAKASHVQDLPEVAGMDIGYGMKAWAAIMSVDLVGSSKRAVRVGARGTFVTMHTYLPIMAELASKHGHVVGLRGDGLFAAFGLTKVMGKYNEVTPEAASEAVRDAANTGKAMLEAAEEAISETLEENRIEGGLMVRVGVDIGDIVVTRIGIDDTQEVTAYGPAVNHACKMGINGEVVISHRAKDVWKGTRDGKLGMDRTGSGDWRVRYGNIKMLER